MMSKRTLATLGVVEESTLGTLDSFTRTFHVPFVTTTTVPTLNVSTRLDGGYILFLRPSYDEALLSIVRHYNWTNILYLYDSDSGMIHCHSRKVHQIITEPQCIGERSIVMSVSICMFVCPGAYLKNHILTSQIFCACCLWTWLGPHLVVCCNTLCRPTSGCVDDVVFSSSGRPSSDVYRYHRRSSVTHCSIVHSNAPAAYYKCLTTAGAKTRRVLRARGAGAEYVMYPLPCLLVCPLMAFHSHVQITVSFLRGRGPTTSNKHSHCPTRRELLLVWRCELAIIRAVAVWGEGDLGCPGVS